MTYASACIGVIFAILAVVSAVTSLSRRSLGLGACVGIIAALVLFLFFINLSKAEESDLAHYASVLRSAKQMQYATFLDGFSRDYLFYSIVFALATIPGVTASFSIMLLPLAAYILLCVAIINLSRKRSLSARVYLPICVGMIVFPQLFSLSGHLVRQFLAAALVTCALSIVNDRRVGGFLLVVVASLIHISAAAFVASFLLALILKSRFNVTGIFFLVAASFFVARNIAGDIGQYFSDGGNLVLVAARISSTENTWDVQSLPSSGYFFCSIFLLLILGSEAKRSVVSHGYKCLVICAVVCLVCIGSAVLIPALAEVALRYLFYVYFLFPLALVYFIEENYRLRATLSLFPIFSAALFFVYLFQPSWEYALLESF